MEKMDLSDLNLADKEERILQSAIKLFSEKGFNAATSREIAQDAGVAEGTIFKYFKTKKDILSSILVHLINLVSEKIVLKGIKDIFEENKDRDIKEILKKIIYDRMKLVDKIYPMAQVIFVEAILHEDVRDAIYNKIIKNALVIFEGFCKEMIARGVIRKDIDPQIIFRPILGSIGLFIASRKIFGKYFASGDLDEEIDKVVDTILNGILVK